MSKPDEKAVATAADLMNDEAKFLAGLESDAKGDATGEEIREQFGNMAPELEGIQIKHQGANMIVFPDGEKIDGSDGFVAVVLASNFHNAFFEHSFEESEGDERPICKSADGVTIDEGVEKPQAENCSTCPRNRAAVSQAARDAAFARDRDECCGNKLTLVVMRPGHSVPYLLKLGPSGFKPFQKYAQRVGGKTRFLLHHVATKITTKTVGKFQHSEPDFEYLGALPEPLRKQNDEAHASYLAFLRKTANVRRDEDETDAAARTAKAAAKAAAGEQQESGGAPL